MTPDELGLMMKARELAELAGLDDNREPARFSEFVAVVTDALQEAERRGIERGRDEEIAEWERRRA